MFTISVGMTPADSARHIENDLKVWKDVVDTAKLKFAD